MNSYQPLPGYPNHTNHFAFSQPYHQSLDQKAQTSFRIKEIDRDLDSGCFLVFKIWIWFLIVSSFLGVLYSLGFAFFLFILLASKVLNGWLFFMFLPICLIWLICQQFVQWNAMRKKSLDGANRALNLVTFLLGFTLLLISNSFFGTPEDRPLTLYYSLPPALIILPINIYGAYKVQSKLRERDILSQKLEAYYYGYA